MQEQFITAYGGLRGAVGFSLVEMIDSSIVPPKQMFVTTTLAVVMFTVFFQVRNIFGTKELITQYLELRNFYVNTQVFENIIYHFI